MSPTTTSSAPLDFPYREGFLWGAATAAHQVEGNNYASDWWQLEHAGSAVIAEPSGDAADHFHRWPEDLNLLQRLGLNSYRFSIEWARIEPEPGFTSRASIDHYRRMVAGCLERGLTPMVTVQHVTLPAWFRRAGGWASDGAAEIFTRYVESILPVINEGAPWVCTINEPNLQPLMTGLHRGDPRALNAWNGGPMPTPTDEEVADLITAHRAAAQVVREGTSAKAGWSVSVAEYQSDEAGAALAEEHFEAHEGRFLRVGAEDDFIGVQNYYRVRFGADGLIPPGPGDRMTDLWEFYPEALGAAVRDAYRLTDGTSVIVTENGIPTTDDTLRIEYLDRALHSLGRVINDGVDVRGYFHWSALDNFEWALGYQPKFGLIEVDPTTFERRLKPSAYHYSNIVTGRMTTI